MSLVSRGTLWRHGPFLDLRIPHTRSSLFTHPFPSPATIIQRSFARATKPAKPPLKPAKPVTPAPRPSRDYLDPKTSYARLFAKRSSPTLLYQSPTTATYQLACVLTGAASIAYALFNLWDTFAVPHPGLVWFVPWLMAFVCSFMLGIGVHVLRNGTRLVRSVSAVPASIANNIGVNIGAGGLVLRVELRSLIGRRRVLERTMHDVRAGKGIAEAMVEHMDPKGLAMEMGKFPATEAGRRAAQVAKRKLEREQRRETFTNPFLHLGSVIRRATRRVSRGIRRVVMRDGFVDLDVRRKGGGRWKTWRMDVSEGWLLEGGSPLKRLLR